MQLAGLIDDERALIENEIISSVHEKVQSHFPLYVPTSTFV